MILSSSRWRGAGLCPMLIKEVEATRTLQSALAPHMKISTVVSTNCMISYHLSLIKYHLSLITRPSHEDLNGGQYQLYDLLSLITYQVSLITYHSPLTWRSQRWSVTTLWSLIMDDIMGRHNWKHAYCINTYVYKTHTLEDLHNSIKNFQRYNLWLLGPGFGNTSIHVFKDFDHPRRWFKIKTEREGYSCYHTSTNCQNQDTQNPATTFILR